MAISLWQPPKARASSKYGHEKNKDEIVLRGGGVRHRPTGRGALCTYERSRRKDTAKSNQRRATVWTSQLEAERELRAAKCVFQKLRATKANRSDSGTIIPPNLIFLVCSRTKPFPLRSQAAPRKRGDDTDT